MRIMERFNKVCRVVKDKAPLISAGILITLSTAICSRPDPEGIRYSQNIRDELQAGSVEILNGKFRVDSDVNRRAWEEVLYFFVNGKSNLSYYERKEEVINPIFHDFNQKPSERDIDGRGWMVYFPQNGLNATAVVLDKNTAPHILVNNYPNLNILDELPFLKRKVVVKEMRIDPKTSSPVVYYQEYDGSLQRIAAATTVR